MSIRPASFAQGMAAFALLTTVMTMCAQAAEQRMTITITNDARVGTLSEFPTLVVLGPEIEGFTYEEFLRTDGYDLRFWTDESLTTALPYEIEQWDTNAWAFTFSPAALSDLEVWFRADAGVLSAGTAVTNWQDQSGNNNHAVQMTVAARPTLIEGVLNGKPVLRFDGGDSLATANLAANFPSAATLFIVATINSDTDYNLLTSNTGSPSQDHQRWSGNGRGYPAFFRSPRIESYCNMPSTGSHLFSVRSAAASWEMWIAGASQGAVGGSYNAGGVHTIGGGGNGGPLVGDIAEVVIYSRSLTDEEITQVGAYLAAKYALTSPYPSGKSYAWVKVPTVTAGASFVASWGNAARQDQEAYTTDGSVWTEDYHAVWHLNESSGHPQDASPGNIDGINDGGVTFSGGKVDGGALIDAEGDDIQLGTALSTSAFSAGLWYYFGSVGAQSWNTVFVKNGGTYHHIIIQDSNRQIGFYNGSFFNSGVALALGEWHHLYLVVNGSNAKLFRNGTQIFESNSFFDNTVNTLQRVSTYNGTAQGAWGTLDQIEFSTVTRASNWVWSAWANQAQNQGFLGFGEIQQAAGPLINITNGAANPGSTAAWLQGTLVSTGNLPTEVWSYWGTASGGTDESAWQATNYFGFNSQATPVAYSNLAENLASNTLYAYTYRAASSEGTNWAPVGTFYTLGVPEVVTPAPSGVTEDEATLRATLNLGGTAALTIYWGASDGGAVPANWSHTNVLGSASIGETLTASVNLGGPGTYYVRAYATNGYGEDWSDASLRFVTTVEDVIYVNGDATGDNDGSSWGHAFTRLEDALAASSSGKQIWVARGIYKPTTGTSRTATFQMVSGVEVYGGFAGDETALEQRNWEANVTTLSGEIGGETRHDNSLHVVTGTGAASVRLDGFTITRGYAWDSSADSEPNRNGGGYLLHQSEVFPTIANCRFIDNAANYQGGAIFFNYNANGSVGPVISNCYFEGNYTFRGGDNGGAIYMFHRKPLLVSDSTFVNNTTKGNGGAYWSQYSDASFLRCTFSGNMGNSGGAIYAERADATSIDDTRLIDCVFYNNRADVWGGALYWDRFTRTTDLISNCWFYANSSGSQGSMAAHMHRFSGTIADCVLSGNSASAAQPSGALYLNSASAPTLLRSAIVGNRSGNYGAGIAGRNGAKPTLVNCIVAGNESIGRGAGLYLQDDGPASALTAINSTFAENESTHTTLGNSGGAIYAQDGTFGITNSILWGNRSAASGGSQIAVVSAVALNLRNNVLENGVAGVYSSAATVNDHGGNATGDPLFNTTTGTWTDSGRVDSGVSRTTFTDATANWTPGALAGKFVNPDANSDNLIYYIATNTATTLTILGRASGSGAAYTLYGFDPRAGSPAVDSGFAAAAPTTDYANTARPQGGGADMGAFESIFDSAAPANVSGLVSTPAHGQVALSWTNPGDADFAGVLILRRIGAAPTGAPVDTNAYVEGASLGDGTVVYAGPGASATPGGASGWTDVDLVNGTDYHYAVHAYDEMPNYADGAAANAIPAADGAATADVGGLAAAGGDRQIALTWTNPADADFAGVLILRRAGAAAPTGTPVALTTYGSGQTIGDGTVVYAGPGLDADPGDASGWTDTNLDNAATYSYAVLAYDEGPNYAGGASASATTDADAAAPAAVTALTATPDISLIALDWWNPNDADFAAVLILRRTGAAPTGLPAEGITYSAGQTIGNGTVVYAGLGADDGAGAQSGWTDSGLTNGTVYHYAVFARDEALNYAAAAEVSASPTDATVIYVNHAAGGANNGTSWANAYVNLQSALSAATAGQDVWVARGTYTPGAARTDTFQMVSGVDLYGGFFGDESSLDERDWVAYETILSGEIGSAAATDNTLHVITATGADDIRIDGFIVTRGYAWNSATDNDPSRDGGGLLINSSTVYPVIANCRFVDNAANYKGGAIYLNYPGSDYTGPIITNCSFEGNYTFRGSADYNGGALYVFHRVITTIDDCTFTDNQANEGGAIYAEHGELRISNSTFARNTSISSRGGAITYVKSSADWLRESWLIDCSFSGNTAVHWGGAVYWSRFYDTLSRISGCRFFDNTAQQRNANALYLHQFDGTLEDCIFSGNRSTTSAGEGGSLHLELSDPVIRNTIIVGSQTGHRGGGIYSGTDSRPRAENLLLAGNRSRYDGAGAALFDLNGVDSRSASFVNCTIADNVSYEANAAYGGGGLYLRDGKVTLRNTLLHGNDGFNGDQVHVSLVASVITLDHNLIAGGLGGIYNPNSATLADLGGNITSDPGFEQAAGTWTAGSVYSSASGKTVLTDAGQNWEADSLVGQFVNPDTATANYRYYIEANSATTLTVLGQASGGASAPYSIRSYHLASGSEAIDAGSASGTGSDLDGTTRPQPLGGATDVGAFEYVSDTEPPDNIVNLAVLEGAEQIQFSWTSPTNSDFSGVLVLRAISAAPTGVPTDTNSYTVGSTIGDGQVVFLSTGVAPGANTGWTDGSLTNGVDYHYRFFAYDGIPNYASGVAASGSPADDDTPPADVSMLAASGGDRQVTLTWTNPADIDFTGVLIVRRANFVSTGAPVDGQTYAVNDSVVNGTVVYAGVGSNAAPGAASGWLDTELSNGATYWYKVYAYDEVPNYATGVATNAITLVDATPPASVTSLGATPDDSSVALTWYNPAAADFSGVLILRKAGSVPTGAPTHTNSYTFGQMIGDGQVVYIGGGNASAPNAFSGHTDTAGLTNGVVYHYAVFAYDEVPNYASAAVVSTTPQVLNVIYVDIDGAGPLYNGTSWENAFTTLQDALTVATAGKDIWVAQGTYKPGAARTDKFAMVDEVDIFGGFTNGMGSLTERDWDAYPTILSGDIDGNGLLDSGNSYNVVAGANDAALDGFTVTMGFANNATTDPYRGGGGFYVWNSADYPTIRNCRFIHNAGWIYGGAIMLRFPSGGSQETLISNCTFTANYTWYSGEGGGAINLFHRRRITIADSTFADNVASNGNGGAVYIQYGHPDIRNSTFARNRAPVNYGGAVWVTSDTDTPLLAPMSISNCVFYANACNIYGGAVYLSRGLNALGDVVTDSDFYANHSYGYDGALFLQSFKGTVRDCRFSGNRVGTGNSRGGALSLESSDCEIENVIVVGTDGGHRGGGIFGNTDSRPRIQNALLAGNRVRYDGAGICLYDLAATEIRSATLVNATVTRNRTWDANALFGGAGVYARLGTLDLRNTIVFDNDAAGSGDNVFLSQAASTLNVTFSELGGGLGAIHNPQSGTISDAGGNLDADPLFVGGASGTWTEAGVYADATGHAVLTDAAAGWQPGELEGKFINVNGAVENLLFYIATNDATTVTVWGFATNASLGAGYQLFDFRLTGTSPCLNTGTNFGPALDLDGVARPQPAGGRYDIGAYERAAVLITVDDVSVLEGSLNQTTALVFTVTLSSVADDDVTVLYATADGTATVADNDYTATSGLLEIVTGQTSAQITVSVKGDNLDEGAEEYFFLNLSDAVNASIGDDQGRGTITDDDDAAPPPPPESVFMFR